MLVERDGGWRPDTRRQRADGVDYAVRGFRMRQEGAFAGIELWTRDSDGDAHWRIRTRENVTRVFGLTGASRVADPAAPGRVFQWLIDEQCDALGNRIVYTWRPEDGRDAPPGEAGGEAVRYIGEVAYGNYAAGGAERFAVRVVFDYGTFSPDHPEAAGVGRVADAAGPLHELSERVRACARGGGAPNILVYHQFHDRFDGEPTLTRSVALNLCADLRGARERRPEPVPPRRGGGDRVVPPVRRELSGPCLTPPVTLGYTPFRPDAQRFATLDVAGGGGLPGFLSDGRFTSVGPQRRGAGGHPVPQRGGHPGMGTPGRRPLRRASAPRARSRSRINAGDAPGRRSCPSTATASSTSWCHAFGRSGSFRHVGPGRWDAFRAFAGSPTEMQGRAAELVDMNGSGRADLAVLDAEAVRRLPVAGARRVRAAGPGGAARRPAAGGRRRPGRVADLRRPRRRRVVAPRARPRRLWSSTGPTSATAVSGRGS